MSIVFGITCGVFVGFIFGMRVGIDIQREVTERVGTAMDQVQKRHQAQLEGQGSRSP